MRFFLKTAGDGAGSFAMAFDAVGTSAAKDNAQILSTMVGAKLLLQWTDQGDLPTGMQSFVVSPQLPLVVTGGGIVGGTFSTAPMTLV